VIVLPFPPAILSGHATAGQNWKKIAATRQYREFGKLATKEAGERVAGEGDIHLHITFYPPDRRGDRINFPARMKPLIDGIADALGVNDVRFLPSYHFHAPEKPGRVEVRINPTTQPEEA